MEGKLEIPTLSLPSILSGLVVLSTNEKYLKHEYLAEVKDGTVGLEIIFVVTTHKIMWISTSSRQITSKDLSSAVAVEELNADSFQIIFFSEPPKTKVQMFSSLYPLQGISCECGWVC